MYKHPTPHGAFAIVDTQSEARSSFDGGMAPLSKREVELLRNTYNKDKAPSELIKSLFQVKTVFFGAKIETITDLRGANDGSRNDQK
jgi:hypothetical protein